MQNPPQMPEAPQTNTPVSDAAQGNWVDRFAPPATRPYLRLSRADRPIGTWLLLIPCLWGIALAALHDGFRPHDLWLVAGCGIGAFLMRGLEKVRAEFSLTALAYNMTRAINLVGVPGAMAEFG